MAVNKKLMHSLVALACVVMAGNAWSAETGQEGAVPVVMTTPQAGMAMPDGPTSVAAAANQQTVGRDASQVAIASGQVGDLQPPRPAGRKPCRKPSGELLEDRSGDMDEFSNFDKR